MNEFHSNFNILDTVISSLGKRLSRHYRSRKGKEDSSKEGEAKQCQFGELYFSAEKHYER